MTVETVSCILNIGLYYFWVIKLKEIDQMKMWDKPVMTKLNIMYTLGGKEPGKQEEIKINPAGKVVKSTHS